MRRLALALLVLPLGGCGWFGGSGGETPAELVDFPPAATVSELWSFDTGTGPDKAFLRLAPALARDTLYVSDARGRVSALAPDSGKELWQTELKLEVTGGVGFGDDLVLVASRKGEVVALDKGSGKEQWRANVASEVLAPPAAAAGVVVVQTVDGRLTGLAAATGQRLWSVERSEPALSLRGTATPVIVSDVLLTGFASGKLAAVGLRDGRVLWEIPVAQPQGRSEIERLIDVDVPVLVAGSTLLAAAYQGKIVAVSLESGRLLWSRELSTYSALAADGANVYVSDARGQVYALDLTSGATVWKQDKLLGRRPGAPAVVGNAVAVGDFDGYVHWLARDDGRFLARERAARAALLNAPLADGATLYVSAQNGDLTALRIEPRTP
jgi:outer membrane protein assembly factor BamB